MLKSDIIPIPSKLTLTRFKLANERQTLLLEASAQTLDAREYMAEIASTPHVVRGVASTAVGASDAETRALRKRAEQRFKAGAAEFPYAVKFDAQGRAQRGGKCVVHGGCVLLVDIDDGLTEETFANLDARLVETGAHAVFSTSWSHCLDVAQRHWAGRLRVLVDRNVLAGELEAARVGLGVRLGITIDVKAAGQHTLYYEAACPPERATLAFHRTWTGAPLSVDELVILGRARIEARQSEKRAQAAESLHKRGAFVLVGSDVQASDADRRAALEALREDCRTFSKLGDARKRVALVLGLKYGATVRIGGASELAVRAAFASVLADYADHWENGFRAGLAGEAREIEPVRSYDALVTREVKETSGKRRAREQMARQTPDERVGIAQARAQLPDVLRSAVRGDGNHVVRFPAGSGKSHATAALAIAECARQGRPIAYAAPNHTVAAQTFAKLPDDVRENAVHLYNPTVPDMETPVCPRADKVRLKVFSLGVPQGQVCRACPEKVGCGAREAYEEREQRARTATVRFVSHAGIARVMDPETVLIVDEMPGVFECVEITRTQLETIRGRWVLVNAKLAVREIVPQLARLWLGDESIDASELRARVAELEDTGLLDDVHGDLSDSASKWLEIAANMLKVARAGVEPEHLLGGGIRAMVPTDAYRALVEPGQTRVLLSATPNLHALPGATVHACDVYDACPWHERTMRYRADRGKRALEAEIPWRDLAAYFATLRTAARGGRILLITFKSLEDAIRANPERVGGLDGIELAHYGATLGLNIYQEGEPRACRVFATFGDPWLAHIGTLEALGASGDELWTAATEQAAGELYQAHERARAVFAMWPVRFFHEGAVAPGGWHPGNATLETLEDAGSEATEALDGLVESGMKLATIADACGATLRAVELWRERGQVPAEYGPTLDGLLPRLRDRLWSGEEPAHKQARYKARKARSVRWAQRLAAVDAMDADASAEHEARSAAFAYYVRELLEAS